MSFRMRKIFPFAKKTKPFNSLWRRTVTKIEVNEKYIKWKLTQQMELENRN